MSWVNVGVTVVGAVGASQASKAGKKGAAGQQAAAAAATEEERRQFDLARQDQQPFLQAGYDSVNAQNAALGGDFSAFEKSPDYAYTFDQSMKGLDRSAAAGGGFMGGGADADRVALGQGLASQNFGQWWNRHAGRAGQAQSGATNLGALGAGMAGRIGDNLMSGANARASSYANSANAWSNFGDQAADAFGSYMGQRKG